MDLSDNICGFCCLVHTKINLTKLEEDQDEFLHRFMGQQEDNESVANLVICNSCKIKLDDFRQFWEQCRRNIKMMKMIKKENEKPKQLEEPDSTWTLKLDKKYMEHFKLQNINDSQIHKSQGVTTNSISITEADETKSEEEKYSEIIREASRIRNIQCGKEESNQKACLNKITIQETSVGPESSELEENSMNVTPDVSIVMEAVNTSETENNYEVLEEPVSPPSSTAMMSTSSIFNPSEVPILKPCAKGLIYRKFESYQDPTGYLSVRSLNSDDRRKERNREASRRYRERARGDPELLKKMREQQNARQKKYYARLRMKKQHSGDWDTAGEEEQGRG